MASNYVEILVRSRDQGAKPEMDELRVKLNDLAGKVAEARVMVEDTAAAAKLDDLQAKLLRLDRATARPNINMEQAIRAESQLHNLDAVFTKIGDDAQSGGQKADKALDDVGKKAKQTGQDAANGLSPLLMGAFVTAASVGPGILLAGTAAAVLGAGALVTKGNAQLQGSYQNLARDASDAIETATAPLIPQLQGAINVLDQGIGKTGAELKDAFAAAAPMAQDMAHGVLSLADNALPGVATGLRAIAPYSHEIAEDFGKLGTGVSGFFSGLSGGAGGGMAGFSALIDVVSHLLTDIGQITGSLAGGLGPALHDISDVAIPVAGALTSFVNAIPPGVIRAAADATVALFLAFKGASLAGLLSEGATFLSFLRGAALAEDAAATGAKAWGIAMDAIPLVAVGAAIAGLAVAADKLGGSGDHTSVNIDKFTSSLLDAANGSASAQDGVVKMATSFALMNGTMGMSLQGLKDIDTSLANLYQSNPAAAAKEFDAITASLKGQGQSADQIAKEFPQYTQALADAQLQAKETAASTQVVSGSVDVLTQRLTAANLSTQDSARQSAAATLAALGFSDGEGTLATSLDATLQAFSENSGAASALKQAYDALFGKYANYSEAQAQFTLDLENVAKQVVSGRDATNLSTDAGAKNLQVFKQLADQNETRAEALLRETGSQDKANTSLQQGALALDAAAKKAGFTKDQIDQLNLSLYGTKNLSDLKITVSANTAPAEDKVRGLLNNIDSSQAFVQVNAVGGNTGGKAYLPNAHGGIIGGIGAAATGGVHGTLTKINEQGEEMVRLPSGSMVMSHPDTMREIGRRQDASSRAAPSVTEVSFSGDLDSAFATAFMGLIREGKIQIKQKALVP
ncbi:hypothetical protein [Actinocrinis sp.]|uniref:hypothetical protein n=1 Tax=Actinocrinis sp. TaxID=1920516 RepID=UPI002D005BD8|nr:hypothetical protein [Actinocrinis sp.]HXR74006.1 hypothetical protein [Actinocrinis sp.]